MTIIVNPFEGIGITPGGGWTSAHQGQDFKTPRIYDYTAPSDGVVEYVGGTYNSIIVRMPDGRRWRLAEVGQILVSKNGQVKRGQVIGRNALLRGGIYRSPHLNGGGDIGRSLFTNMVTHTKAQAAAADAAAAAPKLTQRRVKAGADVVRRMGPGTKYNVAGADLKAGELGNFIAFAHGPASQGQPVGNDVWYQGFRGHWFWSGGFTTVDGTGLVDKTKEFADLIVITPPVVEVPVVVVPEPEAPEGPIDPIPEPEIPVIEVPVVVAPDPEPELPEEPVVVPEPEVPVTPEPETPVVEEPKPVDPVKPKTTFVDVIIAIIESIKRLFGVK